LFVLLVIIAVVGVFGFKALNKGESSIISTASKPMLATVRVVIRSDMVSTVSKNDQLISLLKPVDAYVDSIVTRPCEDKVYTSDGKIVYTVDPKKADMSITFRMKTDGSSIIKLESQDVAVGKSFIFKTKKAEFSGYIEKIEFK
jgi:uncharacterized protein (UPF0333 family)